MELWTFRGTDGLERTVPAKTEREARHLAMVHRWGEPSPHDEIYRSPYMGLGLTMLRREPCPA